MIPGSGLGADVLAVAIGWPFYTHQNLGQAKGFIAPASRPRTALHAWAETRPCSGHRVRSGGPLWGPLWGPTLELEWTPAKMPGARLVLFGGNIARTRPADSG